MISRTEERIERRLKATNKMRPQEFAEKEKESTWQQ